MGHTVSVVIPAYNAEAYLAQTLESAFAQTLPPDEVIVVDDGSTDHTADIAASYGDRVSLIRQANRGESGARNAGVVSATGRVIAFLDADDVWLPEYLVSQMEAFEQTDGQGLVFCDGYMWKGGVSRGPAIGHGGVGFVPEDPLLSIVQGYPILASAVLVPRDFLIQAGFFREGLIYGPDVNMWLRLAKAGFRFHHNPIPLFLYRARSDSLSNSRRREAASNLAAALQRIQRDLGFPRHVRLAAARRARRLPRRFEALAREALLNGDFREARACALSALRGRPWNLMYGSEALAFSLAPRLGRRVALGLRSLRHVMLRRTPVSGA